MLRAVKTPAGNDRRRAVGEDGERAVRAHIQALGWHLIDHNVRWREGELDLIALDQTTLVFAEVKTLVGRGPDGRPGFSPFESIGRRKQDQIRTLARRWLVDQPPRLRELAGRRICDLRFDAFAVTLDVAGGVSSIEHLPDAF